MRYLPPWCLTALTEFAPVIYGQTRWNRIEVLVVGAILVTGSRTVSAVLRVMGKSEERNYALYQQVLSRAVWSGLEAASVLLRLLLKTFDTGGVLLLGIDETIERRRGDKIEAKGIYRDPVRSSKGHFVKASGLRWISLMWLTTIPLAQRVWALPFLTALAPSERYYEPRGRTPKKISDWARQLVKQARRWLPGRQIVVVGDTAYAALEFLGACASLSEPVTVITRLRLDAALYESAPPRPPKAKRPPKRQAQRPAGRLRAPGAGRPRKKGQRLPTPQQLIDDPKTVWTRRTMRWYHQEDRLLDLATGTAVWYHPGLPVVPIRFVLIRDVADKFDPQALLSTDLSLTFEQILAFFQQRWQIEPTFRHVREHLGVETQRQWSPNAITRTTPLLLGLFSFITILAQRLWSRQPVLPRQAAWYHKSRPTFSDALALVRARLWDALIFSTSTETPDMVEIPRAFLERFRDLLCYTT